MMKNFRKIMLQTGFATLLSASAWAQAYEPMTVTSGFTADVIANGANTSLASTTLAVDDATTTGNGG